jgi:hypothetical protein
MADGQAMDPIGARLPCARTIPSPWQGLGSVRGPARAGRTRPLTEALKLGRLFVEV